MEKLTNEVLGLNGQIDELGRKSVPLILKCGERIKTIHDYYKKEKTPWGEWLELVKDKISSVTVWRYQRIYEISLVKDFKGMTLNEVYEACGLIRKGTDEENKSSKGPKSNGTPDDPKDTKKTPFEKFHRLLSQVQDIQDETFTEPETHTLVKCGQVFVKWYTDNGGQVPINPVPVVEMEYAA